MTIAKTPNIIWAPNDQTEPPAFYQDGRQRIELPPADVAKRGFYSAESARIIKLSGGRFKQFVLKGTPVVTGTGSGRKKRK